MNVHCNNLRISTKPPKSDQGVEGTSATIDPDPWQLSEIENGLKELDEGQGVDHADVKGWLQSWGKSDPSWAADHAAFVNGAIFARRFLADFLLVECKSEEESF